jgi:hypothetical protein
MNANIILTYGDRPQQIFDVNLQDLSIDFKKSMLLNVLSNLDLDSYNNLVKLSACFECDFKEADQNILTSTALKCNAKLYFNNGKLI